MSADTQSATMRIGEVAAHAGLRSSTIRYYESVGMLPEPERVGGQRRYTIDVLRRLAIIDVAQRAGFSLDEIRELLAATAGREPAYESLRPLAEGKLPAIEALIERAQAVRSWLEVASACECDTLDVCALFDDRALGPPERPGNGAARELPSIVTVAGSESATR